MVRLQTRFKQNYKQRRAPIADKRGAAVSMNHGGLEAVVLLVAATGKPTLCGAVASRRPPVPSEPRHSPRNPQH